MLFQSSSNSQKHHKTTIRHRKSIVTPPKINHEMDQYLKEDRRLVNLFQTDPTLERLVFACDVQQLSDWSPELYWNVVPRTSGQLYMFLTDRYPRVRIVLTRDHENVSEVFLSFALSFRNKFAAHAQNLQINFDRLNIISLTFPSKTTCRKLLELIDFVNDRKLESALLEPEVRTEREEALMKKGFEAMKNRKSDYTICLENNGIMNNEERDQQQHNRQMAENQFNLLVRAPALLKD